MLTLGSANPIRLVGYLDSDYANCPNTSRSISGYCFTLGSGAISWMFKKQRIMADSLCYTKYIALHDTSHKVAFLCTLLTGLSFSPSSLTPIHCNNDAAHTLAEDHIGHPNVKHICVKFHHIRQLMEDGSVSLLRMQSANNTADILTKPLAQGNFQCLPLVFIPHLDGTPILCEEEHFPCPGHLHIYPLLTPLTHYIHDSWTLLQILATCLVHSHGCIHHTIHPRVPHKKECWSVTLSHNTQTNRHVTG